jgi:hypothetical protein
MQRRSSQILGPLRSEIPPDVLWMNHEHELNNAYSDPATDPH